MTVCCVLAITAKVSKPSIIEVDFRSTLGQISYPENVNTSSISLSYSHFTPYLLVRYFSLTTVNYGQVHCAIIRKGF